jgi:uncharacterized protein YcbK (DUF882 family)
MDFKKPYINNFIKNKVIRKMLNSEPRSYKKEEKSEPKANKMEISKYVNYKEVIKSRTAVINDIDNTPNEEQLERIRVLCRNLFDPLRVWAGGPIIVTSLFRSEELNDELGGSSTSQHMANDGAAIDIDDTYEHKTNAEMFHYIKDNLEFDQLIAEFPKDGEPQWIHASYREGNNRGNVFIATKVNGETTYLHYNGNENLVD